jgi:outer membrane protein assembly factor BamB
MPTLETERLVLRMFRASEFDWKKTETKSAPGRRWVQIAAVWAMLSLTAAGVGCSRRPMRAVDQPATPAINVPLACAMFGGGVGRNLANTVEKNIAATWSVEEGRPQNLRWSVRLGDRAYGGPVVFGDKVFVATNNKAPRNPMITGHKGVLMCFRAADGKFLWQAVHDLVKDINPEARSEGMASTPAAEGNRIYYVSNGCELICADTDGQPNGDARVLWRLDMMRDLGVYPHKLPNGSPLLVGELLFVCTGNGLGDDNQVHAPQAPSLIAVNKKDGTVRWQDSSPGDKIRLGQWSNPTYGVIHGQGQVIFAGGDGWLRAFAAETGKPIWRFDCNSKGDAAGARGDRNYLVGTPVVYDNKVYIGTGQEPSLGSGEAKFWCVDMTRTGDVSPLDATGAPNPNSALVWCFDGPVDPATAEVTKRDYAFGRTVSTCAIVDDLIYISEVAGLLHCLDAQTGKAYWVHDFKTDVWGSPYYVDGKVFLGTADGDVHVFAHSKVEQWLGMVEMDSAICTPPVAADGVLYVMTSKYLYALAPGRKP